ncbi:hypothetical protein [Bradyrhizobium prioriisuperbiae]|uniref:hypothetical protein n=1 Tax=Bradyrhizobium prioriisuperbiae TaxID=2854389 RepID=UPI0028ED4201|nr:hypothetical protein [Bradyrhizobium prioritasuperba]
MTPTISLTSLVCAAALALMSLVSIPSFVAPAAAQDRAAQEKACSRDVSRHCRKLMNDGDFAIQQCLLQNREKLSPSCRKVVEGQ